MTAVRVRPATRLPTVEVVPAGRTSTADEVIRHALAASVQRLVAHDPVIRDGRDPEGVHQARVATRRLRSDLRTFRPLLDRAWADGLRDRLSELADLLGAARDADVLGERIRRDVDRLAEADRPGAAPVIAALETARDAARAELSTELQSAGYGRLLSDLAAAATSPHCNTLARAPGADVLPPLATKAWRRLKRNIAALPDEPEDAALHQIRILAKRARYAIDAVSPVTRSQVSALAAQIAELQDVLGRQHDAVVAEDWLRRQVAQGRGDPLTVGQLVAMQRAEAATEREAWPDVWRRIRRRRPDSWV
ncbi:MAG: CHAD domain-containing protein [Candidatus Dormibacteraeota bacterium]|nr:CHAD domain-containing protein [Candidatus Dormibacteraeota bacterium]